MKILHTCEFYHPHVGGAERIVQELSERLAARGHEVTVATTRDPARAAWTARGEPGGAPRLHGVTVREYDVSGNAVKGFRGDVAGYLTDLGAGDWDVILNFAAQNWPTDLTLRVLDRLRARTVLAASGYSGLAGWRRPLYRAYFRRLPAVLRRYDAVIYHSERYRDKTFGDRHGIKHFRIIPTAVDSEEFARPVRSFREHFAIARPHLLVAVGNHYRAKGHLRAWQAVRALARDDVCLAVIGRDPGGPLRSAWSRTRRAAERDDRLLVPDPLPRELVVSAILEADLLLIGSRVEAAPLVALEAMAAGTPFVSFDVGNVRDLPGGRVVANITAMSEAVGSLLDHPETRAALAAEGQVAQRTTYEWDRVVDEYEALYRELTAA